MGFVFDYQRKRREFCDRFNGTNPDLKDYLWRTGRGEFSAHMDISFEKYLAQQRKLLFENKATVF